jgi:hypothetical protein
MLQMEQQEYIYIYSNYELLLGLVPAGVVNCISLPIIILKTSLSNLGPETEVVRDLSQPLQRPSNE